MLGRTILAVYNYNSQRSKPFRWKRIIVERTPAEFPKNGAGIENKWPLWVLPVPLPLRVSLLNS